jgi:mannose-1-phosphate guanylyltransferase/mannose-6-phosphate isomerase
MPEISIDYGVMEKTKNILLCPLPVSWSDVGSWDSVYDVLDKDHNSNVKVGNIVDIDTKNSLIIGGKRLISTIGLEDVLIVETPDALFMAKKGESQKVKKLIEELQKRGKKEASGEANDLVKESDHYKIFARHLSAFSKISIQAVKEGIRYFIVARGSAKIGIESEEKVLTAGEMFSLVAKQMATIENSDAAPFEYLEIQMENFSRESLSLKEYP